MTDYRVRLATLDDEAVLARQRSAMFEDMGMTFDRTELETAFRLWLRDLMPRGDYRAWLVETPERHLVSGGGITIIPWPPGPRYLNDRLAFVYNVYTDPAHRQRGLARLVMQAIHAWCEEQGIRSLALNASRFGRPLYESLGYSVTPSPMMFLSLR
jgi:GNAT superfamily N-acetyltransferase